jgi:flagellar motility protein MotE (MotC chaperone)
MLTYKDEQTVRQIVKEEVRQEVKDQLTDFRSDMKTSLDTILKEVVAVRQNFTMVEGHKDQLEELSATAKDHENRITGLESALSTNA